MNQEFIDDAAPVLNKFPRLKKIYELAEEVFIAAGREQRFYHEIEVFFRNLHPEVTPQNEKKFAYCFVDYLIKAYVGSDYWLIDDERILRQTRKDVMARFTPAELREWILDEEDQHKAKIEALEEIQEYLSDSKRLSMVTAKMASFFREIGCLFQYTEGLIKTVKPKFPWPSEAEEKQLINDLINSAVQTLTNLDEDRKRRLLSYFEDSELDGEALRNRIVEELTTQEIREWLKAA